MTHLLAMLSPWEIAIIAGVVVLLFGATKIPQMMRGLGQGIHEFKSGLREGSEKPEDDKKEPKKEGDGPPPA
jgi:sec-independent protein translocase protein TatA